MHTVEDIDGVTIARAQVTSGSGHPPAVGLTLCAASGFVDGRYYPAESITIDTIEGVTALYNVCKAMLEAHAVEVEIGASHGPNAP